MKQKYGDELKIERLMKFKKERIKEIRSKKKPRKPSYLSVTLKYWLLLVAFILLSVYIVYCVHYISSQPNEEVLIYLCVPIIEILYLLYCVIFKYRQKLKEHKKIVKNWDKKINKEIKEVEEEFETYIDQILLTGSITTDDKNMRLKLGLVPKCPHCGSTDIDEVSELKREVTALTIGILNPSARAQFKCNDCG